jgi:lipoprotein-releasing system permease protein
MSKSFASYIALRYVSVGKRSQLVSFMSLLSVGGLALGITILITVLSIMNGFDREVRENILGVVPHATVKSYEKESRENWEAVQHIVNTYPDIISHAPLIETMGVVATSGTSATAYSKGVLVNGIDPRRTDQVTMLARFVREGSISALGEQRFMIVLGETLADNLGVVVGDKVNLYSLNISINPIAPLPTQRQFTVAGIYKIGTLELDSAMAIITLQDAQALYRFGNSFSGLRLTSLDVLAVNQMRARLSRELPSGFYVETWTQIFGNIYENIKLSRTIVGFLLWLLVAVAAFNLVVSLIMIVRDKRGDIAILRTMGASPGTIGRIFMTQGLIVGLMGTVIGVSFGILFSLTIGDIAAFIEQALGVTLLSADVYPVDFLPSELRLSDIFVVSVGVLVLCLFATIYPAWRAARVQPAEALRLE